MVTVAQRSKRILPWATESRYTIAGLIAVAFLIRLAVVLATPHFVPRTDGIDFDRIGVWLAEHGSFGRSILAPVGGTAFRVPGFPLLLAAVYKIFGTDPSVRWTAARVVEAGLGCVTVWLIYAIADRTWGRRVALTAAAIATIDPTLVLVGSSLLSESLLIPLILAAVLAALTARRSVHTIRWSIAAGVAAGLAALTHGNAILLVPPLAFLVWTVRPRRALRSLKAPAALLAATLLTLTPWTIRNAEVFHAFVPISTQIGYGLDGVYNAQVARAPAEPALWQTPLRGMLIAVIRDPRLNEAQLSDRLTSMALHYIGDHPLYPLRVAFWSTTRMLDLTGAGFERDQAYSEAYPPTLAVISVYAFWLLGLLAVAGIVAERAARRAPAAFWLCPILVVVPSIFLLGDTRYRSPAEGFIVILGAIGLLAAVRRAAALRRPRP
jgi:4-amino-4-deoxy-L-arabinose transferase-like glycosyltransferase